MKYKYKDFNVYSRQLDNGYTEFFYEFVFSANSAIRDKLIVNSQVFQEAKQMSHEAWRICEKVVIDFTCKKQLKLSQIKEIMKPLGGICDKPVTSNWIVHNC